MVAWVVIDRQHHRKAGPFASLLSTPLIPLPHPSPLLPIPYGHSYTTAAPQPLCNQSLTHSFHRHGGYPLSQVVGTSSLRAKPRSHSSLPTTVASFVFMLLRTLLLSFAFFCTRAKLNSLVFNRFRTLCEKPPGVGYPPRALPEVADKPQLFSWASGRSFLPKAGSIDRLLGCI